MSTDLSRRHLSRRYAGPRIRLSGGRARLLPPVTVIPEGMVRARFSVLSPGTERRHLATAGGARDAGYMTLGGDETSGWVLAPVPHGAAFDPRSDGAVNVPPGTRVQVAAMARFQQMALLGLDRLPAGADLDDAVVVGSGPVALGCVLELHRRGATQVRVLTSRPQAPISRVPGVQCVTTLRRASAGLVVDAVGSPRRAAVLLAPGGTLGLLGTPDAGSALSSLALHRSGWNAVGMHELVALDPGRYQAAYTTTAEWLEEHLDPALVNSWCRIIPGACAPELYGRLGGPDRPAEPVLIFSWEP